MAGLADLAGQAGSSVTYGGKGKRGRRRGKHQFIQYLGRNISNAYIVECMHMDVKDGINSA